MVSRIERFSSIVKRCEGLMKGGVMHKKPIWYDVYVKHPPFEEPTVLREKPDVQINEIFYEEDIERAKKMQTLKASKTELGDGRRRRERFTTNERRVQKPTQSEEERHKKELELFDLSD